MEAGSLLRSAWKALKSVRLAVALIAAIGAGAAAATLFPGGAGYFGSPLFIAPAGLFVANLAACALSRLARELRKKARRRHGPDLLHLGLLVLVAGAAFSSAARREGAVSLRVGDTVEMPSGERLTLVDFTDERYPDGRPRGWTSVLEIGGGKDVPRKRRLEVNAPFRVGSMKIYQASYGSEPEAVFTNTETGTTFRLGEGQTAESAGARFRFEGLDASGAALVRAAGLPGIDLFRIDSSGVDAGPFRVVLSSTPTSGLHAIADPGYPLVLAGLLLVAFGATLTFIQKAMEKRI